MRSRQRLRTISALTEWEELGGQFGHSCDAVLDLEQPQPDSLRNYVEERYDTNPLEEDSTAI